VCVVWFSPPLSLTLWPARAPPPGGGGGPGSLPLVKNFSLFNHVNRLSTEVDKLETNNGDIQAEIDKYKGSGVSSDNQRRRIIRELEERIKKTDGRAESYTKKYVPHTLS
jgi:hypothetical protein